MSPLWADFRAALGQPEYVHVLLNPIPVYGLGTALILFVLGWIGRSRPVQIAGLLVMALAEAAAGPVVHFGHAAYDRVYSMSDPTAQQWLNWHQRLGERIVWVYYVSAVLAAAAALALARRSRHAAIPRTLALASALGAFGSGAFLAFVGGKIRHGEFRDRPPPAAAHVSSDYEE